jgi:hypothetical protein
MQNYKEYRNSPASISCFKEEYADMPEIITDIKAVHSE